MLETTVEYLGGVRFEATARGHRVVCDQPVEDRGSDAGMSPPEFLLAALGTCAGYYAAEYLRTRSLAAEGLRVRVEAEKAKSPARLGSFRIEVTVPGLQEERHREGVLRAVKACLIHNTLMQPPAVDFSVHTAGPATMLAGTHFGTTGNTE